MREHEGNLSTFLVVGGSGATHDEDGRWLVHSDLATMPNALRALTPLVI